MKKSIILLSLLATCAFANAKSVNKPIECVNAKALLNAIAVNEEFQEKPVWGGKTELPSHVVLFVNTKTGTWTLVEMDKTTACILAVGTDAEVSEQFFQQR